MDLYQEALARFSDLLNKARQTELNEPTAMSLATADSSGRPSVRTVLLKGADERGFVFYTNFGSRKGVQLNSNSRAALGFYWDPLKEQVNIEGPVEKVSDEEADNYWVTRPRESQIGGWASEQSRPLEGRTTLIARVAKYEIKYVARAVPRPPHWSGFRLVPERIEFWSSRPFRLHERMLYQKIEGKWTKGLLFP